MKVKADCEAHQALTEALEYFEEKEDADFDGGSYRPNEEMQLATSLRRMLESNSQHNTCCSTTSGAD